MFDLRNEQEAQRQERATEVAGEARAYHAPEVGTAHALVASPQDRWISAGIGTGGMSARVKTVTTRLRF
ncbi:hypothetical protein TBR22_A20670 [Luteitalea sp. TBR-22]|nr:hypothetical protein TBR22_A20670 [Luteitalea sp. TBR-22]